MSDTKHFEKSCGAVVYTVTQEGLKYLLVCEKNGFWGFPKGHMEHGETEQETARREIKEETALDVKFINGFRTMDEHSLAREGHPERIKQTVYFLAEYEDQDYQPQETEVANIELMDYDSAIAAFQFESFRRILAKAKTFLGNA